MVIHFELAQLPESYFELHKNIWTGKIKLFINGEEIEAYSEKDKLYIIPSHGVEHISIYVKDVFYEFAPHLIVNGIKTTIVAELRWYDYLIGALPILLFFIGGGLGAGIGLGATYLNMSILRSQDQSFIKYCKVVGVVIASYLIFLMLAIVINRLINS